METAPVNQRRVTTSGGVMHNLYIALCLRSTPNEMLSVSYV